MFDFAKKKIEFTELSLIITTLILFGSGAKAGACTIGVANGNATTDNRPLLWKNRDSTQAQQQLMYVQGQKYSYIGIASLGGNLDGEIYMGLNSAGLALGNSVVKIEDAPTDNYKIQTHILTNFDSMGQIRNYLQSEIRAGKCNGSGCFPFIDAKGNAVIFEVNRADWLIEYDTMDPDRVSQNVADFVVRANEFHKQSDGTDNRSILGRYRAALVNMSGLINAKQLSGLTLLQGNDGSSKGFEFARYGPGRNWDAIARDDTPQERWPTLSMIAVHGVKPGEDPALTTMWTMLGPPNYCIAVPTWVKVSDIPKCLSSGDMYDRAKSLHDKKNEADTQASIFPAEAHIYNLVANTLLPYWREFGVASIAEMTRIEHQIANDAYSLLECLDNRQHNNKAPEISIAVSSKALKANLKLKANDPDGSITNIKWNFGNGKTSQEKAPSHTYQKQGTYLVSCTVTDNHNVSITDWQYCKITAKK